jgi:hypothetical protein
VPAPEQARRGGSKADDERRDLERLAAPLPPALRDEITGLWDEYEAARTPEARLAKGLDKLETILQHTQGRNPPGFDYRFNLGYGRAYTDDHPVLAALRGPAGRRDRAPRARIRPVTPMRRLRPLSLLLLAASCSRGRPRGAPAGGAARAAAAGPAPIAPEALLAHARALAADSMEGRAIGTPAGRGRAPTCCAPSATRGCSRSATPSRRRSPRPGATGASGAA